MASSNVMLTMPLDEDLSSGDEVSHSLQEGVINHILACKANPKIEAAIDRMHNAALTAFTWAPEVKSAIAQSYKTYYLGWRGRGTELTNGFPDNREIYNFVNEGEQIKGAAGRLDTFLSNQWPDSSIVGLGFRTAVEEYMQVMRLVYKAVLRQMEIAYSLPEDSLTALDGPDVPHRLKIVKYFPMDAAEAEWRSAQGVGAHQDETGWLTFVSEVDQPGLKVHLATGSQWIPVELQQYSWAVNIGKAFERATMGKVQATLHKVDSPAANAPPRHSVIFFAALPLDTSYALLEQIFGKSKSLQNVPAWDVSRLSEQYRQWLEVVNCKDSVYRTFGDSQSAMYSKSYIAAGHNEVRG